MTGNRETDTQARSQTWVRCRVSANGTRALPIELNVAPAGCCFPNQASLEVLLILLGQQHFLKV